MIIKSKEYISKYCCDNIYTNINKIESIFGLMNYYYENDYPDDDYKTSVCICLINTETGKYLSIWDYKNWNYNSKEINKFENIEFSVYYEDENDFNKLKILLNEI